MTPGGPKRKSRRACPAASPYRAGTSVNWLKVKNPKHPAMQRVKEALDPKSSGRH
jgi:hypothetical protein